MQADLDEVVEILCDEPRYALDTEFHRERTYYPKLALIQVAWRSATGQQVALIDPLAVDVDGRSPQLFASDALCVIHAAQQDLDVLTHAVGSVPSGCSTRNSPPVSSATARRRWCRCSRGRSGSLRPKGDRLTDWLRRPLTDSQCQYAAVDVEYLLELHERLVAKLAETGRIAWVGGRL